MLERLSSGKNNTFPPPPPVMVGLKDFYSMIGSISEILLHDWWHLRAFLALISLTGPSR